MLTALLLAACTVAATETPTPVLRWDAVANADLAGYSLFYREVGGTFQKLRDFPCEWYDLDNDGTNVVRFCRGADLGVPLQRYCPSCVPGTLYEFSAKAYNLSGMSSATYSNVVSVCFSPVCERGLPCN
jgi:hypothetical protein